MIKNVNAPLVIKWGMWCHCVITLFQSFKHGWDGNHSPRFPSRCPILHGSEWNCQLPDGLRCQSAGNTLRPWVTTLGFLRSELQFLNNRKTRASWDIHNISRKRDMGSWHRAWKLCYFEHNRPGAWFLIVEQIGLNQWFSNRGPQQTSRGAQISLKLK